MENSLKTGEVAARAGVNVETLRYYERQGLLREPTRGASGYREYTLDDVRLVRFVKRAQALGFTLKEVRELLQLRESARASCADVRAAANAKLGAIDRKIQDLQALRLALGKLVSSCKREGSVRECPILEALDEVQPPTVRGRP